jgi:hypothetical protein
MKILSVEAEMFHADRRTDMTKLMVSFEIFRMRLKKNAGREFTQSLSPGVFALEYRVNC